MISIRKNWLFAILLGFLGPAGFLSASDDELKLETILPGSEYERFIEESRYRNRIRILRRAMEHKLQQLDIFLQHAEPEHMLRLLSEVGVLADAALEESEKEEDQGELRHREVKRLEIMLRKTIDDLERMQLAFSFDERRPFEETREKLIELRTRLLSQLFGEALIESEGRAAPLPIAHGFAPSRAVGAQGLEVIDRFTLEEFEKVQDARKITDRVKVLMEIASDRLEEIERRRQEQEWTQKDPNPLEYFTYPDLLHAYSRALNSAMVNIDEQATRSMATEKDIRKALEELNRKVQQFLPQLNGLEEFVREREVGELTRKYRDAVKATETAFQGSLYGLGAPVEP